MSDSVPSDRASSGRLSQPAGDPGTARTSRRRLESAMTEHEHDVPPRPAFVLQVRNDHNGAPTAWLDGEQITVPPGVGIHRALIRAARRRADRTQPGRTIRVTGMTPDGSTFDLGIGPDGDAWAVPPVETDAAAEGALTDAPTEPADEPAAPTEPITPAEPVNAFRPIVPATPADEPVNAFRPVVPATPADEPEPHPAYAPEDPDAPQSLTPPTAPLTDDHGRPIPTTTAPATAPLGFGSAPRPEEPDDADDEPADDPVDGPSRRTLLLGGAGAVVLLGAATAGFFALHSGDDTVSQPTPTTSGNPLPDGIRPPAGLPASYLWSVVKLSDVAPRLVATAEQLVLTVDNDTTGGTQLVSLDPQTGKSQWKADLPVDAVVADGPALVPIDGTDSIVLTTQTQLMAYPMGGGEPKTWPLEAKWSVALTQSGVLVTKPEDNKRAFVLYGDKLAPRALPEGANPVAMLADGALVAADAHGHVWLGSDATKAPKPKKLKAPRDTTPGTFVAATRDQIITAFVPNNEPEASLLRAFSLPKLKPRITTAPVRPAVFPANFMLAPDQSWAVAGNTWVDMTTGASHVITARWSPIAISQYNCWSKSGDNVLTATNRGKSLGPATAANGQVAIPEGGTAKVVYCVASIGSDTTLYAVPLKG